MHIRKLSLAAVIVVLTAIAVACDSDGDGGQLIRAPIDSATVVVLDSNPPQYTVKIVAGLPDGCSSPADHSVKHDGLVYEIEVRNRHTGAEVCTTIYGQYELTVALDDVQAGQPYTVRVNDQTLSFVAEQ
jgi:hypothetical protein